MKKRCNIIGIKSSAYLTACLCLASAAAFDYGFLLSNDSRIEAIGNNSYYLNQQNEVSAWLKIPFGKGVSHYLAAEGLYRFEYDDRTSFDANYADLQLFKYVWGTDTGRGFLEIDAGRFFTADATSRIFAQNADGLRVSFTGGQYAVQISGSYTGLLNGNIVKMRNAKDFDLPDDEKLYSLADKYVNAMVTATFPNVFLYQSVSVQGIASVRINETMYNRFYGTISIAGPIYRSLMYDACASMGFSQYDESVTISPFAKGTVSYYFTETAVNLDVLFAGKDFTGITSMTAYSSASEPEFTDILMAGISVLSKPADVSLFSAGFDAVFDGTEQYEFKGCQYNLGVVLQIASDVQSSIDWIQYIDAHSSGEHYCELSFKAKLAL
ncbi:MAG: hypothetical protein J6K96_07165 [Treponema sp.]|nr:hypothetical protein [Treponema sp.]